MLSEKEIFSRGGGRRGPGGHLQFKEKPKNFGKTLVRIFKYLGRAKNYLIILFVVVIFTTCLGLLGPILQGNAINAIKAKELETLIKILITLLSVYVAYAFLELISMLTSTHLSQSMVRTMRKDVFDKMITLSIRYFDTHQHGDIMSRVTNDVDNISNTVSQSLTSLIKYLPSILR